LKSKDHAIFEENSLLTVGVADLGRDFPLIEARETAVFADFSPFYHGCPLALVSP
jgi:hypothetical protein